MSMNLPDVLGDNKPVNPFGWLVTEWDEYVRLFKNFEDQTAIGEASAAYLWSTTAAKNIASRRPDARIVMILRDPAERAFSQYLHQLAAGLIRCSFRQHLQNCMRSDRHCISTQYPLAERMAIP